MTLEIYQSLYMQPVFVLRATCIQVQPLSVSLLQQEQVCVQIPPHNQQCKAALPGQWRWQWSAKKYEQQGINLKVGDRDRGGQISKNWRGDENIEFPEAAEIDPFLQRFYRKSPIWRSKVQVFGRQLSGRVPPPSSVQYVLTPLSRSP